MAAMWKEAIQNAYDESKNALNTSRTVQSVVFHAGATQAANGKSFDVGACNVLTVDIDGAIASAVVEFQAKGENGVWRALKGIRLSDWKTGTSTTATTTASETWQFDVSGLAAVRMKINSITGGSLTVKGRAVS